MSALHTTGRKVAYATLIVLALAWGIAAFAAFSFSLSFSSSGGEGAFVWLGGALALAGVGATVYAGWRSGPLFGFAILALVAVVFFSTCALSW